MAKRFGADVDALLVAEHAGPIRCNGELSVNVETSFADCPPLDLILIPGGQGTRTEVDNQALIGFVQRQAAQCGWVTSVCTGAFILERAGLLNGKRATTHWASLERLRELGSVEVALARLVVDGNTVTSAGVAAGIDMALSLVKRIWGTEVALKTQKQMEYYPQPPFSAEEVASVNPPAYLLRRREIVMPQMGTDMDAVTLTRWLKEPGDRVQFGEVIAEIETDKATVEIESNVEGTFDRAVVEQDSTVLPGQVIAYVVEAERS